MKYSRKEIETEYNVAALEQDEFAKVKWASQEKMLNRFKLAMRELPFATIGSWLDVGCGTGAFQALVRSSGHSVQCTAIDMSANLLEFASSREDVGSVRFKLVDFMDFPVEPFELITCIGVIQKTSFTVDDFFCKVSQLLTPGGLLFLDTKNLEWEKFQEPGFDPEPTHQWFRLSDLEQSAGRCGMEIVKKAGYLPGEGLMVEPEKSHTIFLIARKTGDTEPLYRR